MTLKANSGTEFIPSDESSSEADSVSVTGSDAELMTMMDSNEPVSADSIFAPVRPGLARVEAKMKTVEAELFTPLANAFIDLIGSGGKRLRPAVALMSVQLYRDGGEQPVWETDQRVISLSASVEMLHTATLVHDDVIDGALLRRGAPTLNAQWNRGATVLAGDFMFARAANFAAETQSPRVIKIFSDTLEIIVNGELRQLWSRRQFHQCKEEYYERIGAKTASLFRAASEAAGVLAAMDEEDIQRLRTYGHNLGIAFQIVDDILDFTGDEQSLGKPAGSDLLQGTMTLPFFHYVQSLSNPDAALDELEQGYIDSEDDVDAWQKTVTELALAVKDSAAIEDARREAVAYLVQAKTSLSTFPDSEYLTSLLDLCDFVAQRTH